MSQYLIPVCLIALFSISFAQIAQPKCPDYEYTCESGKCIPPEWRCDGKEDCPGGDDELDPCPTKAPCRPDQFQCDSGKCIPDSWFCDGYDDCGDNSDEPPVCPCKEFECNDGKCIPNSFVCDKYNDCAEGEDELNCPTRPPCTPPQFECEDGTCLPEYYKCDNRNDCPNGEDEQDCGDCEDGKIPCPSGTGCILPEYLCDSLEDCPDGSDEKNCGAKATKNYILTEKKHKPFFDRDVREKRKLKINKKAKIPSNFVKRYA